MKIDELIKINDFKWKIPKDESLGMRVDGIIFADELMLKKAIDEETLKQVANVATLLGIQKASYAMPDIHYGYGFPIGGVAATDVNEGVISPGGVGFDIACGVRILRTDLEFKDMKDKIGPLMDEMYATIPKGVGSKSKIKLNDDEMKKIFTKGVSAVIKSGYGFEEDESFIEENGCLEGAAFEHVSRQAINRGNDQLGSLGSGNHFIEVQKVSQIFDKRAADVLGIFEGQIVIMIHSGSRGLGHQICSDYIRVMQAATVKYKLSIPDRQLACAPVHSKEGQDYYSAMACAANFAMSNRQCLAHWVRSSFEKVFGSSAARLGMDLVYDVSHNVAKLERHTVEGRQVQTCVHRKGATRSFGPDHPDLPKKYSKIGQPVIIPGDMGRYSYILTGTKEAMLESFGSTCHGAGRLMSRSKAKRQINGFELKKRLLDENQIIVMAANLSSLAEEAPDAYKDVSLVVDVAENAKISKKVAKMVPLGVIKG